MIKLFLIFTFITLTVAAQSTPQADYVKYLKQSQKQYQAQDYAAVLESLELAKATGVTLTSQWYYLSGLSRMKLKKQDEAVADFNSYINSVDPANSTRGYFFIGQIYTQQKKYEEALTHYELAVDTSTDPKLDRVIESSIERTLRLQRQSTQDKPHNLGLLLGYAYDDNAVNLNSFFFEENIKGHALSYGATYSYTVSKSENSKLEPGISVLDSYTLDGTFKSNEVVQSKDALQINAVIPVQFTLNETKNKNLYTLALNSYAVYLPLTNTKRELALTSLGVRSNLRQIVQPKWVMRYELNLNFDRSYGFTNSDDDASGLRADVRVGSSYDWNYSFIQKLNANLSVESSSTKGLNTKYRKYYVDIGLADTLAEKLTGSLNMHVYHLNYYEKNPVRNDTQAALGYSVSYEIDRESLLDAMVKYTTTSSTTDLYKASDVSLGLQYAHVLSF